MTKPARKEPYVAPGAPKSPLALAIAGGVVGLLAIISNLTGKEITVHLDDVAEVVSAVLIIWGLVTNWLARREQASGVKALADAKAELPEGALASDSTADTAQVM